MKRYLIGAIVGAALTVGLTAHAEVSNMVGKVIDGVFPVKVEGELLENEAIVIQGTSYLPVREFAETLGYEVSFDMQEGIELDTIKTEDQEQAVSPEPESNEVTTETDRETPKYTDFQGNEIIPKLEYYNMEINALNVFLESHERWGTLGDEAESYRQEKARLEAERAQHYPDWDK